MKLSKLLAASFLLLAFLVASTVQQDVESDNNPAANDKIDDMTDVEVVPEAKKEVVEVDENSAAEAAASGEAAAAAGQSQAKTDDEAATVIKEATERLEKLKEKGTDDTEQQQPAVVEAVHLGASHDDDASSLGLKPEAIVAASDDSESKTQEVAAAADAEKQVEKEEPSVVEIINDSAPGDIAELKQPSAVKSSETESEIAPAAPAVVAEASSGESEQSQSQSKDEASDSSSSSDSKSSDVEYKDEDVKKPEEVRASEVIPDPYDEVKSSENQAAAAKSDDDKLLLQPEPIKSGVSVAGESKSKPAAVASESEPTIMKDSGEPSAVGGAASNSNPRPFKVNEFFIIIPGIVLAIVVLIVVMFVVYNKTSLCGTREQIYDPVSQEPRTIYRGNDAATSSAQV